MGCAVVNPAALRVVPDGWAARHRPIVDGFFPDTVDLQRKTGTTEGPLKERIAVWTTYAPDVPALVQVNQGALSPDRRESAGSNIAVTDYTARFPVEHLPEPGDRVVVTASPDPANLGTYTVHRRESQGHVVDRTVHLERVAHDATD